MSRLIYFWHKNNFFELGLFNVLSNIPHAYFGKGTPLHFVGIQPLKERLFIKQ